MDRLAIKTIQDNTLYSYPGGSSKISSKSILSKLKSKPQIIAYNEHIISGGQSRLQMCIIIDQGEINISNSNLFSKGDFVNNPPIQ